MAALLATCYILIDELSFILGLHSIAAHISRPMPTWGLYNVITGATETLCHKLSSQSGITVFISGVLLLLCLIEHLGTLEHHR